MQAFEIFFPGKHTAANGVSLEFGEDLLKQSVAAYDPSLHEAPIVVGHPKDNHPAFGWIKGLEFKEGKVYAVPGDDLDADFAELVAKGRYKKRSASWYLPDAPNNPKPGTLYLRHVGFLGAMPPSLKGLKDVSFAEEEGVVEFGDTSPWIWSTLGNAMRSVREWIIGKDGVEAADKVMPAYIIDELNSEADRARRAMQEAAANVAVPAPVFNEPNQEPVMSLTPEQIAAIQAENERLKAQSKQSADFAEAEKNLKAREAQIARKEIGIEVDALITAGKVLPAQKAGLVEFMAGLADAEATVEFGEGEAAQKVSPRKFMKDFLGSMPKVVDFGERSGDPKPGGTELTAQELAAKAGEYHAAQAAKGNHISFTEAVDAVKTGKATA